MKNYGRIVDVLHRHTNIPGIVDFVAMKVSENIDTKSTDAIRMYGNVAEDYFLVFVFLYYVSSNVIKVRKVLFKLEDVMVTFYENLAPNATAQRLKLMAVDRHIAQKINPISRMYDSVPIIHERFIMFFDCFKRTKRTSIFSFEAEDVRMTKVCIC